jgi:hypothetical protein
MELKLKDKLYIEENFRKMDIAFAHTIIRSALEHGYTLSAYYDRKDKRELLIEESSDFDAIFSTLFTTNSEELKFRNNNYKTIGKVRCLWGVGGCFQFMSETQALGALIDKLAEQLRHAHKIMEEEWIGRGYSQPYRFHQGITWTIDVC